MYHDRTKHIGVKYYFIHLNVFNIDVQVQKINTKGNLADMGTKVVSGKSYSTVGTSCISP